MINALGLLLALVTILCGTTIADATAQEAHAVAVCEKAGVIEGESDFTASILAPKNTAQFVFDARTGQYRNLANGQFVSPRNLPWPSNNGFASSAPGTLKPGTVIDRFGKDTGRYAGQPGATVGQRGMAQGADAAPYTQYEVLKPLPAEIGPASPVPAFGAEGGATQYMFQQSIRDLVEQGFLRAR